MTTLKTSTLTGAALDWAVAKCAGIKVFSAGGFYVYTHDDADGYHHISYTPSTDWAQGGPIIERENIQLLIDTLGNHFAVLWIKGIGYGPRMDGPDPLIAAMRCYVASKLGNTVDVPPELV